MRLTDQAMADALSVFAQAVDVCLQRLGNTPMYSKAHGWISEVRRYNAHAIFRPDLMSDVATNIFSDEDVRNFVLEVQFHFYAMAGNGPGFLEGLCQNLEDALTIDGPIREYNQLPKEMAQSMPMAFVQGSRRSSNTFRRFLQRWSLFRSAPTLAEVLRSNPLLVTVLLVLLIADIEQPTTP